MVRCIKCGHEKTFCVDSRDHSTYVRRRRECAKCGHRYTTREFIEMEEPKKPDIKELVADMQKSVTCLALELPEAVYDDVACKWEALKKEIKLK